MGFTEERANELLKECDAVDLAWYAAQLESALLIFTKEEAALMMVKPEAAALMAEVQKKALKHGNA